MTINVDVFREEVRAALIRCTGRDAMHSVEEAATLSGIGAPVLYNIRRGVNLRLEDHFVALLEVPGFVEEFFQARGYECAHVGNEEACEWAVTAEVTETAGFIGKLLARGAHRFDHAKSAALADRLRGLTRKCIALIHAVRRRKIAEAANP